MKPVLSLCAILFTVGLTAAIIGSADTSSPRASSVIQPVPAAPVLTAEDRAKQSERRKAIDDLIAARVLMRLDFAGSLPDLYVDRGWYGATIEQKRTIADVVLTYCMAEHDSIDMVAIRDGYSGKTLGGCSVAFGLQLE